VCGEPCETSVLAKLRKGKLMVDLGDHFSVKKVERNSAFSGLLNGDICLFVKSNYGKQIAMSRVLFVCHLFCPFLL
jgi:hypothetical protein